MFVSIDYGSSCEAIKKIPLSCISSVDLASSQISSVKVDQDGKVDIKFISTLKPNLYQYLLQCVYVSDSGNQTIMVVNVADKSCIPFGWTGRYTGPGIFRLALPADDQVLVFTDHSAISFLMDGTPCESLVLDEGVSDSNLSFDTIFVAESNLIRKY